MGKPYSMDLRERVVAAIEGGESTHQAAARFSIGVATAGAWARLKRATGDVRPAKQGKPKGAVLDAHADFIVRALAEAPDTTLDEMVERLREERGVTVVRTSRRRERAHAELAHVAQGARRKARGLGRPIAASASMGLARAAAGHQIAEPPPSETGLWQRNGAPLQTQMAARVPSRPFSKRS
jgi:transposase